jgi:cell division septum initiation protein DivIVA
MATRTTINPSRAQWNGDPNGLIVHLLNEHNKLVDEIEDLKTQVAAHTHGGITAGSGTSSAASTLTYVAADAQKIV